MIASRLLRTCLLPLAVMATLTVVLLAPASANAGFRWGGGLYAAPVEGPGGKTVAWDVRCYEPITRYADHDRYVRVGDQVLPTRIWRTTQVRRLNTPDKAWAAIWILDFYERDLVQFRPFGSHCDNSAYPINNFWSVN